MQNQTNQEPIHVYRPKTKLTYKFWTQTIVIWALVTAGIFSFIAFINFVDDEETEQDSFTEFLNNTFPIYYLIITIVLVALILVFTILYVNMMEFQIWSHEIVVCKGLFNKTEKHVPYRTVTNISTRYGVFDALFGIGTVEIETAGKSGQSTGPEEKIEGVENFEEIRNIILEELRKYRGQYATATEHEHTTPPTQDDSIITTKILNELREIKTILKEK